MPRKPAGLVPWKPRNLQGHDSAPGAIGAAGMIPSNDTTAMSPTPPMWNILLGSGQAPICALRQIVSMFWRTRSHSIKPIGVIRIDCGPERDSMSVDSDPDDELDGSATEAGRRSGSGAFFGTAGRLGVADGFGTVDDFVIATCVTGGALGGGARPGVADGFGTVDDFVTGRVNTLKGGGFGGPTLFGTVGIARTHGGSGIFGIVGASAFGGVTGDADVGGLPNGASPFGGTGVLDRI